MEQGDKSWWGAGDKRWCRVPCGILKLAVYMPFTPDTSWVLALFRAWLQAVVSSAEMRRESKGSPLDVGDPRNLHKKQAAKTKKVTTNLASRISHAYPGGSFPAIPHISSLCRQTRNTKTPLPHMELWERGVRSAYVFYS